MRHLEMIIGATLLALVLPLPAYADPAVPAPAAPPASAPAAPLTVTRPDNDRMARREARRAAMMAADLDAVHAGLQLTASQDKLWPPVADAMRGLDEARGFRFRQTLAAADSSIDGLKLQGDHMASMGVAMGRLADATKPFVAILTPDQKSRLPTLVQRMRPRKIVARAFDLPQDSAGSWGIGQDGQTGAGGMGRQGGGGPGMGGQGTADRGMVGPGGPRAAAPGAGATDQPQQNSDDDE